jgi:hypothetical protein
MLKRGNKSAGRPQPPRASPAGAARAHSADATSVVTFTALSEAQWQAIRSTRNWPGSSDWRGEIEKWAQLFWEKQEKRKIWIERLRGKQAARENKRVNRVLLLTIELQQEWAKLANDDDHFSEDDLPDPSLKLRMQRLTAWLSNYSTWVTQFFGNSDPIQEGLERQLMSTWIEAGGQLDYSRKKNHAGTPYGPLVDFLALTLEAVLGKKYQPSGIAAMIDRQRRRITRVEKYRRGRT